MRFRFTDEQYLLRSEVRALLESEWTVAVLRAAWESGEPALGIRRHLAALGVSGITMPERLGGIGGDELDLVLVLEEFGRAAVPDALALEVAVAVPLIAGADGGLPEQWLPRVAAGESAIAVVLEDRRYVPDVDVAELLIVERAGNLFAVDRSKATLTRQQSVDGARRLFSVVAEGGLLLEVDAGALELARERAALATAAVLLGLSQRMLDMTVAYAKERQQFGHPIGSFQAVKHRLADALVAIELARPVVYAAAWSLARSQANASAPVALAQLFANRAADYAARQSLQIHAGIGFAAEHDLHLWLKRAKALDLASGGSFRQLDRLAAHLGLSAY
jgi:alkylation response protein AidB-like acyl-CoA dehydrogenase